VNAIIESSRQRVALVFTVVGLFVLSVVAYVVLGSSAEASESNSIQAQAKADAGAESESVVDAQDDPLTLPMVTYDVYLDRDPFEPALQEAEEAPEPSEPTDAAPVEPAPTGRIVVDPDTGQLIVVQDTSAATGDPSPTSGDFTTAPSTDPATGRCQGEDEVVCDGRVVTLHEVRTDPGGDIAVIKVDTTTYEVGRGETFASSFRVLSIDGDCVTFLYGDDTSTLCAGQRTLK
jgi:hypothetical protein